MPEKISPEQAGLDLHLYPHDSYLDAMSFLEHTMDATVLAPEIPTAPQRIENDFNSLKKANRPALERLGTALPGDFAKGIITVVRKRFNNPKRRFTVKLLDVPATTEWQTNLSTIQQMDNLQLAPSVDETLAMYRLQLAASTTLQERREQVIADNIDTYARGTLINKNSTSANTRLLVPIGFLHVDLATKLEERGLPVQITTNSFTDGGEYSDVLWTAIKQGEEPTQDQLLRGIISRLIRGERVSGEDQVQSKDTVQRMRVLRAIAESVKNEDLEGIVTDAVVRTSKKGLAGIYEAGDMIMMSQVGQNVLTEAEVTQFPLSKI
jgi:hypothetical protein